MLSSLSVWACVCVCWVLFDSTPNIYRIPATALIFLVLVTSLSLSPPSLSLNSSQMRRLRYIYYLLRPSSSTLHLTSWVLFLARYYIKIGVACLGYVMHYNTIESPPNTILNLDIYFFSIFFLCFLRMHRLIWLMFPCGLYVVMRSMESVDWKWQKKESECDVEGTSGKREWAISRVFSLKCRIS